MKEKRHVELIAEIGALCARPAEREGAMAPHLNTEASAGEPPEDTPQCQREMAEQWAFQSTLEHVDQGISVVDRDLRLVAWNTRLLDLLGFPREFGQRGKPLADFFRYNAERGEYGPGDPEDHVAQRVGLARRFEPHCFERTRPDGTVIEIRGNPLPGGGFVTTYTDITTRKRAEDALRKGAERMRAILESALDCIITMDHEGRIVEFNPAAEKTFGYTRTEAIGSEMAELIIPLALRERHRRGLSHYLQTGEGPVLGKPIEITAMRADGTEFPVELTVIRVPGADPPLFTGFVRDLAKRRELEDQLRQSQKMEAVGRLAGGVAHDFNNLLTVITGRSHILVHYLTAADPLRRHVDLILKTAERAATLTRQLLAFSRKQVLQPRVLDLNTIVAGMRQILRRLIGEDIELVTALSPRLGCVRADPGQIEQVILNLAVNARDAMPQGGRLVLETANVDLNEAFVRHHPGSRPGPHARLVVSDTGVGMDAHVQAHLFEPFFTTKGVGKGTGLGLAMVYGIVKQSGGYIGVATGAGQGARFEIYLPRFENTPDRIQGSQVMDELLRGQETILLVEDQDEVRDMARDILEMSGYSVLEARNGAEAVRLCEQHAGPIEVLVTDVVMPQMSGRQLADRLVSGRPDLKVLYMSGYTDEAIAPHGILDPGVAFLPKPFSPDALSQKVREVLEQARV
jgi:PAS domain S-box-containing protein